MSFPEIQSTVDAMGLTGLEFEEFLQHLYCDLGYSVTRTPASGDYGADLVAEKGGEKTVVQAKRYKDQVGFDAVKEVFFAKAYYGADRASVVTTGSFTSQAVQAARETGVELVGGEELNRLIQRARLLLGSEGLGESWRCITKDQEVMVSGTLTAQTYKAVCGWLDPRDGSMLALRTPDEATAVAQRAFKDNQATDLDLLCGEGSRSLYSIRIGDGVEVIGDGAFEHCRGLEQVELPAGLKGMGEWVFSGTGLRSVNVPGALGELPARTFNLCQNLERASLGEGICRIGARAFFSCYSLREIDLPASLGEIGYGAFCHCDSLTSVKIPGEVKAIAPRAFLCCGSLKEVSFAEGIEEIGEFAFAGCTSLAHVDLPGSLKRVHATAFYSCPAALSVRREEVEVVGCTKEEMVQEIRREIDGIRHRAKALCEFGACLAGEGRKIDSIGVYARGAKDPDGVREILGAYSGMQSPYCDLGDAYCKWSALDDEARGKLCDRARFAMLNGFDDEGNYVPGVTGAGVYWHFPNQLAEAEEKLGRASSGGDAPYAIDGARETVAKAREGFGRLEARYKSILADIGSNYVAMAKRNEEKRLKKERAERKEAEDAEARLGEIAARMREIEEKIDELRAGGASGEREMGEIDEELRAKRSALDALGSLSLLKKRKLSGEIAQLERTRGEAAKSVLTMFEREMRSLAGEKSRISAMSTDRVDARLDTIRSGIAVGGVVRLGAYNQGDAGTVEDIEWCVLAVEGSRILLISRFGLDCRRFNRSVDKGSCWLSSDLRSWLAGEFQSAAFAHKERMLIAEITCLSTDEVKKYFPARGARVCKPTAYAVAQGSYRAACTWWLRSPGKERGDVACVLHDGCVCVLGLPVDSSRHAVRPAMWVEL